MSRERRVDLHLHSRASGKASNWWVKGLGEEVQESYTPPEEAYRMARSAGMDFVTLTDHETVEGALTLIHHTDFSWERRSPPSSRRTVLR
jgi:predicted metal-dependent phosphoesterase TrpH